MSDDDPGTVIGIEVGPSRAIGHSGWAPVVPNNRHYPTPHDAPKWCLRVGGIVPRLHRTEHFLIFDPGLPHYRRCPRCGVTVYMLPPALRPR